MKTLSSSGSKGSASTLLEIAADVVSAYISSNIIIFSDVPLLVADVYATLKTQTHSTTKVPNLFKPAVPIENSITPDFIVCLEDGEHFTSLTRHLAARHDLTPAAYRRKWNLSADYPMVTSRFSKKLSMLAKDAGLGRNRGRGHPNYNSRRK